MWVSIEESKASGESRTHDLLITNDIRRVLTTCYGLLLTVINFWISEAYGRFLCYGLLPAFILKA